jgi:Thioredoxin domain-containing protein
MISLDRGNFDKEVTQSDLPVVVNLWEPRCPACIALMPQVEGLAVDYAGRVKFCKLNRAKNMRLCQDLQLHAKRVPTFLFYRKGKEPCFRLSDDEVTLDSIRRAVNDFI